MWAGLKLWTILRETRALERNSQHQAPSNFTRFQFLQTHHTLAENDGITCCNLLQFVALRFHRYFLCLEEAWAEKLGIHCTVTPDHYEARGRVLCSGGSRADQAEPALWT